MARPLRALQTTTVHAAAEKPARRPFWLICAPSFMYAPSALKATPHTYIWMFCQWMEVAGRPLSSFSL